MKLLLSTVVFLCSIQTSQGLALGPMQPAEFIAYHGYSQAIELKNSTTRVVLCPQVGGRVLEYSLNGDNVLHLSAAEKNWKPGMKPQSSAGRFDIGPEYTIPKPR